MHLKLYDPNGKRITVELINSTPHLAPSETEVVAGRHDLPRIYPALPSTIIVHEAEGPIVGSSADCPRSGPFMAQS